MLVKPTLKILTDNECRSLLNETMHRMDFLEPLHNDVFKYICDKISKSKGNKTYSFIYNKDNDYFSELTINITIKISDNFSNRDFNGAWYYNESRIKNGKLESPTLTINIAKDKSNHFPIFLLKSEIYHELTHLYDDFIWQKNGYEPICLRLSDDNAYAVGCYLLQNEKGLLKQIGWAIYLLNKTENNAFINQSFVELEHLNCTKDNVHKILKKTFAYRNYKKTKIDLEYYIENTADKELETINSYIGIQQLNKIVPHISENNFNASEYRLKLNKWADSIFRNFMKRYCGIVQYYIDYLFNQCQKYR